MSSSQLEDLNEQEGNEAIAKALGISTDELEELNYGDVETDESDEGTIYGYYVEIQKNFSSKEVLDKVIAHVNCDDYSEYVIAHLEFENYPDDDENYESDRPKDDTTPTKPEGGHRLF